MFDKQYREDMNKVLPSEQAAQKAKQALASQANGVLPVAPTPRNASWTKQLARAAVVVLLVGVVGALLWLFLRPARGPGPVELTPSPATTTAPPTATTPPSPSPTVTPSPSPTATETPSPTQTPPPTQTAPPTSSIQPLSLDDQTVTDAYNIIKTYDGFSGWIGQTRAINTVYRADNVTLDDVLDYAYYRAFDEMVKDSSYGHAPTDEETAQANEQIPLSESMVLERVFTEEEYAQVFRRFFGSADNITPKNVFWGGFGSQVLNTGGKYMLLTYQGGGDTGVEEYAPLVKAEYDDDGLYLYSQYIRTDLFPDGSDSKHVYFTADDVVGKQLPNDTDTIETVFDNNKSSVKTFKHTFRKNSNGSYYWVSTEIVN